MWFFRLLSGVPFAILLYLAFSWGTETFGKGYGELVVPVVIVGSLWVFVIYTFVDMFRKAKRVEKEARRKHEQSNKF